MDNASNVSFNRTLAEGYKIPSRETLTPRQNLIQRLFSSAFKPEQKSPDAKGLQTLEKLNNHLNEVSKNIDEKKAYAKVYSKQVNGQNKKEINLLKAELNETNKSLGSINKRINELEAKKTKNGSEQKELSDLTFKQKLLDNKIILLTASLSSKKSVKNSNLSNQIKELSHLRSEWHSMKGDIRKLEAQLKGTRLQDAKVSKQLNRSQKKIDKLFQDFTSNIPGHHAYKVESLGDKLTADLKLLHLSESHTDAIALPVLSDDVEQSIKEQIVKNSGKLDQLLQDCKNDNEGDLVDQIHHLKAELSKMGLETLTGKPSLKDDIYANMTKPQEGIRSFILAGGSLTELTTKAKESFEKGSLSNEERMNVINNLQAAIDAKKETIQRSTFGRLAFEAKEKIGIPSSLRQAEASLKELSINIGVRSHVNYQPSTKNNVAAHKERWNHFDEISSEMISSIPNIPVSSNKSSTTKPVETNFNNYGIRPDPDSVTFDPKDPKSVLEFKYQGETYKREFDNDGNPLPNQRADWVLNDGLIFSTNLVGAMQYHDSVRTSSTPSGTIMTICDGTGQSLASKKTANVATDTAHEAMEKKMGSCSSLHDLFHAQKDAFKEAQDKLQSDETGDGTTYAQVCVRGPDVTILHNGDTLAVSFIPKAGGGWECKLITTGRPSLDPRLSAGILNGRPGEPPEIENMGMTAYRMQPGEVIFAATDGIFDCFDPSNLHEKTPQELGGNGDKWEDNNPDHGQLASRETMNALAEAVKKAKSGQEISDKIYASIEAKTIKGKIDFLKKDNVRWPTGPGIGKPDDAASAFYEYKP